MKKFSEDVKASKAYLALLSNFFNSFSPQSGSSSSTNPLQDEYTTLEKKVDCNCYSIEVDSLRHFDIRCTVSTSKR